MRITGIGPQENSLWISSESWPATVHEGVIFGKMLRLSPMASMIFQDQSPVVGLKSWDVVAMEYSAATDPQVSALGMKRSLSAFLSASSSSRTDAESWKMVFRFMNWMPVSR